MRTTDDAVGGDCLLRTLLLHKARNVGGNRRVMTHVNRLRRPRADRGRIALARSPEHGDDKFGGERAVWTVGGDCGQRISPGEPGP